MVIQEKKCKTFFPVIAPYIIFIRYIFLSVQNVLLSNGR